MSGVLLSGLIVALMLARILLEPEWATEQVRTLLRVQGSGFRAQGSGTANG